MKKKILYIMLMILTFNFVIAQSFYSEDFEDYQITSYNKIYDSEQETDSDGVFENLFSLFGVAGNTTAYIDTVFLISNPNDGYVNEMGFNVTTSSTNINLAELKVDISVCETLAVDIDTAASLRNQCLPLTEVLIVNNFAISDRWGLTVSGQYKTIPLETPYIFDSAKSYLLIFETVDSNEVYTNKYYSMQTDFNTPTFFHYKRQINGVYTRYSTIPSFDLLSAQWDNDNFLTQTNLSCNGGVYSDCKVCIGGSCNGEGYFRLESEADNQYIRMFTNKYSVGNYESVSIKAIIQESGYTIQDNSSLSFKMRVNNVEWSDINTLGFEQRRFYAGIGVNSIQEGIVHIGGFPSTSLENFSLLRINWDFINAPYSLPVNSLCDVNSGDWVSITNHFTKVAANIVNTKTYVNGALCINENITQPIAGGELSLALYSIGVFNVDFDDLVYWESFAPPDYDIEIEDVLFCPIANCIFYDDFESYGDFGDVTLGDWGFQPQAALVFNNILYLNASETFPQIENTEFQENSYKEVIGVVEFRINNSPSPESLEDDFIVYDIQTKCDNNLPIYQYKVVFIRDDDFSGSENRTVVNVYSIENATPKILGTFTMDNSDYFIMFNFLDLNFQKAYLNIYRQVDIEEGFIPEFSFSQDFALPCDMVNTVNIRRRSEDIVDKNFFVGINKVFYYGIDPDELIEDDYVFTNSSEEINISGALIKTEIGDILHNTSNTLGFRSTATKMFFWVIIMAFFIYFALSSENVSRGAKTISVLFIIVSFMTAGWYLKFIPTIVFILMIFTLSVGGALTLSTLFRSEA